MARRKRIADDNDNGFSEWGGYMDAKKAKLINQFSADAARNVDCCDENRIFNGIAIFVNGYTVPSSDELKLLMIKYGGIYHHYYSAKKTTHVIASNLPNCKIKSLNKINDTKVVKPEWIVDSIDAKKLLDYRPYLLYTNQSETQPKLVFKNADNIVDNKPSCSYDVLQNSFKESHEIKISESESLLKEPKENYILENERTVADDSEIEHRSVPNKTENNDTEGGNCHQTCVKNPKLIENGEKEFIVTDSLKSDRSEDSDSRTTEENVGSRSHIKINSHENKNSSSTKNKFARMTASEENFLAEFYSNSRLHHISTMGATFKQYITELRYKNSQNQFPGRNLIKQWLQEQRKCLNDVNELVIDDGDCVDDFGLSDNDTSLTVNNREVWNSGEKIIMHIDMDCFFVSVGIRNRPELKGQPVAVTHAKAKANSDHQLRKESNFKTEIDLYKNRIELKTKVKSLNTSRAENCETIENRRYSWADTIGETDSMSEVASCSYEARKAGVRNGMFLGQALKLCPNLKTIPYDFDAYKNVSYMLYDTVAEYTLDIEAVSCDEMFVDCTKLLKEISCSPLEFASFLRKQIQEKTGCPCSTGFGGNRLQARLATKKAKPNGQYFLQSKDVMQFIKEINVSELPGVGKALAYKLSGMNINSCRNLQNYSLTELKTEFGVKTGEMLYNHCRGVDDRELTFGHVRKSVSAEVNYGIRFQNQDEAEKFLNQLSCEVKNRLQEIHMKAKCITLKLMVKAKEAPEETAKFLGHGFCYNLSKSTSLAIPVSDTSVISREVLSMYRKLGIISRDVRGVGIQLSRLVAVDSEKGNNAVLDRFLKPKPKGSSSKDFRDKSKNELNFNCNTETKVNDSIYTSLTVHNGSRERERKFLTGDLCNIKRESSIITSEYMTKIDEAVLAELPEDIRKEIIENYKLRNNSAFSVNKFDILNVEKNVRNKKNNESKNKDNLVKELSKAKTTAHFQSEEFTVSQIDQSFLCALPVDIQEEILREAKTCSTNKIQQMRRNSLSSKTNLTEKLISAKPNEKYDASEANISDKNDEIDMSLDQIRDLVRKWVAEESSPLLQDVNMIFSLIVKYVYRHCLSNLEIVLNTLYRSVKKKLNEKPWREAFLTIIKSVQEVMVIEYGGELKLEYDISRL